MLPRTSLMLAMLALSGAADHHGGTRPGLLSVEPAYADETEFGKMLAADAAKWKELFKTMPAAK